jgi:hypothetical protein
LVAASNYGRPHQANERSDLERFSFFGDEGQVMGDVIGNVGH